MRAIESGGNVNLSRNKRFAREAVRPLPRLSLIRNERLKIFIVGNNSSGRIRSHACGGRGENRKRPEQWKVLKDCCHYSKFLLHFLQISSPPPPPPPRAPFLRLIKTREESFAPVQWMSILGAFIHREIASQQISKESSRRWWKRGESEGEEICLMVKQLSFFKDIVSRKRFTEPRSYSLLRRKIEQLVKAVRHIKDMAQLFSNSSRALPTWRLLHPLCFLFKCSYVFPQRRTRINCWQRLHSALHAPRISGKKGIWM